MNDIKTVRKISQQFISTITAVHNVITAVHNMITAVHNVIWMDVEIITWVQVECGMKTPA